MIRQRNGSAELILLLLFSVVQFNVRDQRRAEDGLVGPYHLWRDYIAIKDGLELHIANRRGRTVNV